MDLGMFKINSKVLLIIRLSTLELVGDKGPKFR